MTRMFTGSTFISPIVKLLLLITLITFSSAYACNPYPCCNTEGQFGATLSTGLVPRVPEKLHGIRGAIWYAPCALNWNQASLYFDLSYAYWRISKACQNRNISVYAIAPIFRYYLSFYPMYAPYLEISVGPAYLSRTRIAKRNLGEHFTFQDQARFGVAFGKYKEFSASLGFIHYSNASFCVHNSGISVPLILNLDYRF